MSDEQETRVSVAGGKVAAFSVDETTASEGDVFVRLPWADFEIVGQLRWDPDADE